MQASLAVFEAVKEIAGWRRDLYLAQRRQVYEPPGDGRDHRRYGGPMHYLAYRSINTGNAHTSGFDAAG